MLRIGDLIFYTPFIVIISGIISVIYSLINHDKGINRYMIIFNVLSMFSLITPIFIPIIVDLWIIVYGFFAVIAFFIHLISLIICLIKMKKISSCNESYGRIFLIIMISLLLVPKCISLGLIGRDIYYINNSDMIIVYNSEGGGGFGDYHDFIYVVGSKYCLEIDLDVRVLSRSNIFGKKLKKVDSSDYWKLKYSIKNGNDYLKVYDDNELLYEEKLPYFNTEVEDIFVVK